VVFVCVLNHGELIHWTKQFLDSYRDNPPGYPHDSIVVFNNGSPTDADRAMFECLPKCRFIEHNNAGWDIGGFRAASQAMTTDFGVYFGNTAHVRRAGWLDRMEAVWEKFGPGIYGSLATYEISPHLNTTGIWCPPSFITAYPYNVLTKPDRYNFEHGPDAFWRMVWQAGFPALLATWDGEYNWEHWRLPNNIYRRGDQSNCLSFFRHTRAFELGDNNFKANAAHSADNLTDGYFVNYKAQHPNGGANA